MDNKFIGLVIGLVIGVLLIGSLLVPTINDATTTQKTFDNADFARYQMKPLEVGDSWIRSNGTWTYDGEPLTSNSTDGYSVVFTNNEVIRENGTVRGVSYANNSTNNTSEVVVIEENTYLAINSNNISFDYGFGAVPNGDYIMKTYDDAAYVKSNTELWVTGQTALGSDSSTITICTVTGSLSDGFTVSVVNAKNSTVSDITVGEITINANPVTGYVDLYTITSISFEVSGTWADTVLTKTYTYSTFVLPKTVTAELANHLDTDEIAMIAVIPVLMIASLLIFAVRFVTRD